MLTASHTGEYIDKQQSDKKSEEEEKLHMLIYISVRLVCIW